MAAWLGMARRRCGRCVVWAALGRQMPLHRRLRGVAALDDCWSSIASKRMNCSARSGVEIRCRSAAGWFRSGYFRLRLRAVAARCHPSATGVITIRGCCAAALHRNRHRCAGRQRRIRRDVEQTRRRLQPQHRVVQEGDDGSAQDLAKLKLHRRGRCARSQRLQARTRAVVRRSMSSQAMIAPARKGAVNQRLRRGPIILKPPVISFSFSRSSRFKSPDVISNCFRGGHSNDRSRDRPVRNGRGIFSPLQPALSGSNVTVSFTATRIWR